MRILSLQEGFADLSNCDLQEVPISIVRMIKANLITKLDLRNNNIIQIPFELTSLQDVKLTGNPLTTIPSQYRNEKWQVLKRYIQSAVLIADNWDVRKVTVFGEEGSGKTSMIKSIEKDAKIDCSKRMFFFYFLVIYYYYYYL